MILAAVGFYSVKIRLGVNKFDAVKEDKEFDFSDLDPGKIEMDLK